MANRMVTLFGRHCCVSNFGATFCCRAFVNTERYVLKRWRSYHENFTESRFGQELGTVQ